MWRKVIHNNWELSTEIAHPHPTGDTPMSRGAIGCDPQTAQHLLFFPNFFLVFKPRERERGDNFDEQPPTCR